MNHHSPNLPNISSYIDIIDQFIAHTITASEFETTFLRAMKAERRVFGEPVYPILQELFEDADAYVAQPELRTEPDDLDDAQLQVCAIRARTSLRDIGFE